MGDSVPPAILLGEISFPGDFESGMGVGRADAQERVVWGDTKV